MQILSHNPSIRFPNRFFNFFLPTMSSSSSSSNIIADYAKSSRSICKKCSVSIDAKSLRLGVITNRGYDMTIWHHLTCLPFSSTSISSVDSIGGFSSLKSSDQEVLKEMMAGSEKPEEKIMDGDQDPLKESKKETSEVHTRDGDEEKSNSNIIAEYAKSGRSSCKKCSTAIESKSLRLGLVTKDSRGFDMTKWHHLSCFPFSSTSISSVESIGGFPSLKSSEQEALKKLMVVRDKSEETIIDGDNDPVKESKKEISKVHTGDRDKQKPDSNVVTEYAKSSRSSCKKCSTAIDAKALRLGLVTKGFRGIDMTGWHHLGCFPFSSCSISSVESIGGFELLESSDQEALKNLMEGKDRSEEKIVDEPVDAVEGSKRNISKVYTGDEDEEKKVVKKIKVPELELSFSVSDIQDKYMDATLLPKWKAFRTIIFIERDDDLHDSSKIAAFDFDQCLAKTSMRRVGPDAWSLMYPSIPEKLQSLYNDGYKLVIFTNESNIDRWKNKRQVAVDSKLGRLSNFIKSVGVPVQAFVACGIGKPTPDPFRKPQPGMWRIMEHHFNSGIKIDMDRSFYVGDAAGRPDDHSDADIKFAEAIGLKFYVPEYYFR